MSALPESATMKSGDAAQPSSKLAFSSGVVPRCPVGVMMRTVFICWAMLDPLPDSKLIQVKLARPLNRVPSALNKTSETVVKVGCDQAMVEKRAQSAPLRNTLRANIIILPVKIKIFEYSVRCENPPGPRRLPRIRG